MKKLILFTLLLSLALEAQILPISDEIKKRMQEGGSHKKTCPVPLEDLRYLKIPYVNYQGKKEIGELIVHKDIAKQTIKTFKKLYAIKYPIFSMKLVSDFKAKDFDSIEANNTSAYNCRKVANTTKWSNHAFGKAIDINPIENPYISKSGKISHEKSLKYKNRERTNPFDVSQIAMLLENDKAVKIFKRYGWSWGGDWKSIKDYQHFEYKR